ncbi:DUF6099 family protein [Streptomyces boninensis]|uniref:DUF6099 family protein n=1 Tax=Streptomyces boninensis TaxID=2039455 RepID=UPI003B2139B3
MDAIRLIHANRHALAKAGGVAEVLAEARQAQALTEAVRGHLAAGGPEPETVEIRAAQLTDVADPRAALAGLGELLGEVGMALVGVACGDDAEPLYWECMDAIEAAGESRKRVAEALRAIGEEA